MPHFKTAFWSSHILSHFSRMLSFFFLVSHTLEVSESFHSLLQAFCQNELIDPAPDHCVPFNDLFVWTIWRLLTSSRHLLSMSRYNEVVIVNPPSLKCILFCFICVYGAICDSNMCLDCKMFGKGGRLAWHAWVKLLRK